jgi:hypothetical protein
MLENIVILICIVVAAADIALIGHRKRRLTIRGFEVKTITGLRPVLRKERENDHG